jgi:hypothetical protein
MSFRGSTEIISRLIRSASEQSQALEWRDFSQHLPIWIRATGHASAAPHSESRSTIPPRTYDQMEGPRAFMRLLLLNLELYWLRPEKYQLSNACQVNLRLGITDNLLQSYTFERHGLWLMWQCFKLVVQSYKSMSKFNQVLETSQNMIDTLYSKLIATTCVGRTIFDSTVSEYSDYKGEAG